MVPRRHEQDTEKFSIHDMKKIFFLSIWIFLAGIAPAAATRASEEFRNNLPYLAGDRFIVTAGYGSMPTHVKKDAYAIDFSKNGCSAYGALVVAARSGSVWIAQNSGYNGGYGSQILVRSDDGVIARYAHLIAGSIPVRKGDSIPQGTILGEVGDTGLVAGTSCDNHPGTHLHFALYTQAADGIFLPRDPEPISGYTGISRGNWYVSDNVLGATKSNLAVLGAIFHDLFERTEKNGSSMAAVGTNATSGDHDTPVAAPSVANPAQQDLVMRKVASSSSISVHVPIVATASSSGFGVQATSSVPASIATSSGRIMEVPAPVERISPGGVSAVLPYPRMTASGGAASIGASSSPSSSNIDDPMDDTVNFCGNAP